MFGACTPELAAATHQGYCHAVSEMLPGDRADPWTTDHADELWQRAEPPAMARDLGRVAFPAGAADEFEITANETKRGKGTIADKLVELALQGAELFHARDKEPYADAKVNGHRQTMQIGSRALKTWLRFVYFQATGRAPADEHIKNAVAQLAALATFRGAEREVYLRSAWVESTGAAPMVYIDLGSEDWSAVECSASGWRILAEPPVRFRRSQKTGAFPVPLPGGSIDELRHIINAQDDQIPLIVAWMLMVLRGKGPYPVLTISGPAGAAKTTFGRIMLALVDPRNGDLRSPPRDIDDLKAAMGHSHLLAFDNVSALSHPMSDAFCRVATGGEITAREKFTDADEHSVNACRPIFLNGCEAILGRPDLADRSIAVELFAIPETERKTNAEIETAIEAARPRIFGALLDALCVGLREFEKVKLGRMPRMADFAIWGAATERGLWRDGTFLGAYELNQKQALASLAESDQVANAIVEFMQGLNGGAWKGTPTELLRVLTERRATGSWEGWPRTPEALSLRLSGRIAPLLKAAGIFYERGHAAGQRFILLRPDIFRASSSKG